MDFLQISEQDFIDLTKVSGFTLRNVGTGYVIGFLVQGAVMTSKPFINSKEALAFVEKHLDIEHLEQSDYETTVPKTLSKLSEPLIL